MKSKSLRAEVATILLAGIAVVALAGWLAPKVAPSWFDKRTKQAEQSAAATAEVEKRAAAELAAANALADAELKNEQAKSAAVSASVQQIGIAAGQLQDSPQSLFIRRETNFIGPWLQPPDPVKLLEAERRRVAYLEGQIELADKLYSQATKAQVDMQAKASREIADLTARTAKAEARAEQAFAARRAADTNLVESAAYARGKDAVIGVLAAIAALCVVGWVWSKINGFTPTTLGKMIADIRTGESAEMVFDRYVPERLHRKVRIAASDAKQKA